MIRISGFAGQHVAVLGLGRTGIATVRALLAGGAKVSAWDDNEATRAKAQAEGIVLDDLNRRDWQDFSALVMSPGIPLRFPQPHRFVQLATSVGVPVIGDIELFARAVNALPLSERPRVIGITGTNGKSTTTALIGHILKSAGRDARVGGNIGVGVLDLPPLHRNAIYVLELSSYQLDLVDSLRCDAAILLNFSPDHLERHGGMNGYVQAKTRIFRNQYENDWAICGVDDKWATSVYLRLSRLNGRTLCPISCGDAMGRGFSVIDGRLFDVMSGSANKGYDLRRLTAMPGAHNWQNAAAAYAACRAMGLESQAIVAGLESFGGLEHRLETVGKVGKVRFINDSKATNADATQQALKAFSKLYWIAGGISKAGGIEPLAPLFDRVNRAYLIGESADAFGNTLNGKVSAVKSRTLSQAVRSAFEDAVRSDDPAPIVVLSPAAASQDQFRDYEHRGQVFKELVAELAEQVEPKAKAG